MNCSNLLTLCSFDGLTNLTHLNFSGCKIKESRVLKTCQSLEKLTFDGRVKIADFSTFKFTNLTCLDVGYAEIDGLPQLGESLTCFAFKGHLIKNVNSLKKYTNLTELSLSECSEINNFNFLKKLNLVWLEITLARFDDLKVLENSPQLSELNIYGCKQIKNLELLSNFQNLSSLTILNTFKMAYDFQLLGECPKLKKLSPHKFYEL